MSGIKAQIKAAFRQARLDRDEPTKTVIGMLKAQVLNRVKSGQGVEETDELWLEVVQAYAKQLRKSIVEYEKIGDAAAENLAETRFELEFCERYLPTKLDAAATEALVRKIAEDNGIAAGGGRKQMGRLMGMVMKSHRDEVDGDLVRKAAEALLG